MNIVIRCQNTNTNWIMTFESVSDVGFLIDEVPGTTDDTLFKYAVYAFEKATKDRIPIIDPLPKDAAKLVLDYIFTDIATACRLNVICIDAEYLYMRAIAETDDTNENEEEPF